MEQEHGLYCLLDILVRLQSFHRKENGLFGQKSNASNIDFHYFIRDEYSSKNRNIDNGHVSYIQVPRSCFCCLLRNGTLIICIPWIIKGPWIPRGRLFGLFSGVPSKRNTYQKGTLIKRNTHQKEHSIIKRNTH